MAVMAFSNAVAIPSKARCHVFRAKASVRASAGFRPHAPLCVASTDPFDNSAQSLKPEEDSSSARRRAASHARTAAHLAIARARKQDDVLLRVRVSRAQIVQGRLPVDLAHVKVFLSPEALYSDHLLRCQVHRGFLHLFPEIARRGILRDVNDFELQIDNVRLKRNDDNMLRLAVSRFKNGEGKVVNVYADLILNNLPLPPPVSLRRSTLKQRAEDARKNSSLLRMISFYKFVHIDDPEAVVSRLLRLWNDMGVLGRVYVAHEGINAQLAVPVPLWSDFEDSLSGQWQERETCLLPEVIIGAFLNQDRDVRRNEAPFEKLHVRHREKVLADGLERPLDWNRAGREISPIEWHDMLAQRVGNPNDFLPSDKPTPPLVLDCRNDYESEVGRFEGSEPLGTATFRESWDRLEERLADVPRDHPIMTFCTGGIRCNKINAYLEQTMGFTNTVRLAGGIVSYARELKAQGRLEESLFKGVNHVFDGRVGEVITNDALGKCINCGTPTNIQTDCANLRCPRPFDSRMFVQCPDCAVRLAGACCEECLEWSRRGSNERSPSVPDTSGVVDRVVVQRGQSPDQFEQVPDALKRSRHNLGFSPDRRYDLAYAEAMIEDECDILAEIRSRTKSMFPGRAHMMCSPTEARLLQMLVQLTGAKRVLEVGTFTGYSALSLARGLPDVGGIVETCELDEELAAFAASYFERDAKYGPRIRLRIGDAMISLEKLFANFEDGLVEPFDFVFLDGDKNYERYYDILMKGLLRKGGLLVVDNVLFGGHVSQNWHSRLEQSGMDLERPSDVGAIASTGFSKWNDADIIVDDSTLARKRLKSLANARKIAEKIDRFNRRVASDNRAERVMLPIFDGISLIRRRL